jgi:hypothetical protein
MLHSIGDVANSGTALLGFPLADLLCPARRIPTFALSVDVRRMCVVSRRCCVYEALKDCWAVTQGRLSIKAPALCVAGGGRLHGILLGLYVGAARCTV